jgi:hypothetical protein
MSTPKYESHPRLQHERCPWWTRTRAKPWLGALAFAAALVLSACSGSGEGSKEGDLSAPTDGGTTAPEADPRALKVAAGFVSAYGAFDMDRAATYLADGADVSELPGGALDGAFAALFKSIGYEVIPGHCDVAWTTDLGTSVQCPFKYNSFRSEELGNGPYSGSYFDVLVKDNAIVSVSETIEYESNGFSAEMWGPFAKWVKKAHPEDVKVLYTDRTQSQQRVDRKAILLWERRISEYVDQVKAG